MEQLTTIALAGDGKVEIGGHKSDSDGSPCLLKFLPHSQRMQQWTYYWRQQLAKLHIVMLYSIQGVANHAAPHLSV